MTAPILEMRGIAHRFGGLDVLADISLNIAAGQFVSILGPSGAGKSTILRILTGGQQPDRGEILFEGAPLEKWRRPFAFMPQRDALMPWRRVLDNTTLGLEVQGVKRAEARQRVLPLFAEFGLEGFETHYPSELSGGMRQRAALLRTVVQQRPVMLLDEPFGALDALTRFAMQRWLESMWAHHNWTAILVTHDVREAVALSDRIYVLSPRPARIVHEIEIDLPRPRTVAGPHQPKMTAIENTILELLLHPKEE